MQLIQRCNNSVAGGGGVFEYHYIGCCEPLKHQRLFDSNHIIVRIDT